MGAFRTHERGVSRRENAELYLAYRAWRILRDAASRLLRMRLRDEGSLRASW
jgi:hypothetical protein